MYVFDLSMFKLLFFLLHFFVDVCAFSYPRDLWWKIFAVKCIFIILLGRLLFPCDESVFDSLSPSFNLRDTMNKKRACAPVSVTEYGIPITKLPEASGFMNQSLCVVILHCVREWKMYSIRCILAIPFNPLVKNKQLKPASGQLKPAKLVWLVWLILC